MLLSYAFPDKGVREALLKGSKSLFLDGPHQLNHTHVDNQLLSTVHS